MNDRLKSLWKEMVASEFKIVCVCETIGEET